MKWILFKKTEARLMIASTEGDKGRLAIVFPTSTTATMEPESETGRKFTSLGFRYQQRNRAWYRKSAGLAVSHILSAFKGDAELGEMSADEVFLKVPSKEPKKDKVQNSNINQEKINDTTSDSKAVASRRIVDDGERNSRPDRSPSVSASSTDQSFLPERVEREKLSRADDSRPVDENRRVSGLGDRGTDPTVPNEHRDDTFDSDTSNDTSKRTGEPNGSLSTETVERNSLSPEQSKEAASGKNYLPVRGRGSDSEYQSAGKRFAANMEAIELLDELDARESPTLNVEDKDAEKLLKFSGWGGLLEPLSSEANQKKLLSSLDRTELYEARESALTAFYTPDSLAAGIWDLLENKGYRGGRVLETSAGTGVFLNQRLSNFDEEQHFTAVEMEKTTGSILRHTNPDAWVLNQPLERTNLPKEAFDLVVGNFPFGEFKITDPEIENSLSIHNYFMKKSLLRLRVGGVAAVLTSTWTLDSEKSAFRENLAKQADLVSAIRLPGGVFGGSQTDASCDLLVFRKRKEGQPYAGLPFVDVKEMDFRSESSFSTQSAGSTRADYVSGDWASIQINEVYTEDGGGVLVGRPRAVGNRFGDRVQLKLEGELSDVLNVVSEQAALPDKWFDTRNLFTRNGIPQNDVPKSELVIGDPPLVGTLMIGEGHSIRVVTNVLPGEEENTYSIVTTDAKIPKTQYERVIALVSLRDLSRELITVESKDSDDDGVLDSLRQKLNVEYDKFTAEYGYLNGKTNRRWLRRDSLGSFLLGLEIYDAEEDTAEKSTIFSRRSVRPEVERHSAENLRSAIAICFGRLGHIDPDTIANLLGKDFKSALRDEPNILLKDAQSGRWELREAHLSGNVRKKLARAKEAQRTDSDYEASVLELETVMPVDIPAGDICVGLASGWIPITYIKQFAVDMYARNGLPGSKFEITRVITGDVDCHPTSHGSAGYQLIESVETSVIGTPARPFCSLLSAAMTNRPVKVTMKDPESSRTIELKDATFEANRVLDEIKEAFVAWIWQDVDRTEHLESLFNQKFNSYHSEEFKACNYRFTGLSDLWVPREHQEAFVIRALMTGNSMAAHCVGAGKTMEMVMLQMEKKHLGISSKPAISVPNHMLYQLAGEAQSMYPSAKIALIGKEDLEKNNRQAMLARIAMNDWDLVILTHGVMGRIPVPGEFQLDFMMDEIDTLQEALNSSTHRSFSQRRIATALKRKRGRMMKLRDTLDRKAESLSWDMLGIDHLAVDEAHNFKNLELDSAMSLPGVSGSASDRAWALYTKSRYLMSLHGGEEKGLDFFTGTPITNSMSELYTMHRYLHPSIYKEMGISDFGAWAGVFGEVRTELEMLPEGGGFHMRSRLSKFVNLPELLRGFRTFTDIKMREDLDLPVPAHTEHTVVAKKSYWQSLYMEDLTRRARQIRAREVDNTEDNLLKIVGDGRRAAMDMRLIESALPEEENTKLALATKNMLEVYHATHDKLGAQLVFCDVSTPGKNKAYDAYTDVKSRLIKAGVPEGEIAFIHDAESDVAKLSLFKRVRAGVVRFFFGSTEKMGTGTNVQERLAALHDLDAPWRPSDLEQRMGRIVRQGNIFSTVDIFRYTTEDSFDLFMWETNKRKATYISQIMRNPDSAERTMSEDTDINFAEVVAVTTGNPAIREKVQIDSDVAKLQRMEAAFYAARSKGERELESSKKSAVTTQEKLSIAIQDAERIKAYLSDNLRGVEFAIDIYGNVEGFQSANTTWLNPKNAAKALYTAVVNQSLFLDKGDESKPIGAIMGVEINVARGAIGGLFMVLDLGRSSHIEIHETPHHNLRRLVEYVNYDIPNKVTDLKSRHSDLLGYIENLQNRDYSLGFSQADDLQDLRKRQAAVNEILAESAESAASTASEDQPEFDNHLAAYLEGEYEEVVDLSFRQSPSSTPLQPALV